MAGHPAGYLLSTPLAFGGIYLSVGELSIATVSIVMLLALQFLLHRTRIGIAIRAVSSNLVGAQFSGIDINRVVVAVFIVGSLLGAVAGMVVSLAYGNVQSFMGLTVVIKAFVAMVIGGLTSLPGRGDRRHPDRPGRSDCRHLPSERLDRDGRLRAAAPDAAVPAHRASSRGAVP